MFGSTVLEIAIGLAFLYLLLSLLVSATMEMISAWLKLRSQNLWLAIANLLGKYDDEEVRKWARSLYDDGLIRTLSAPARTGIFRDPAWRLVWPKPKGPSYIPAGAFATALLEKIGRDGDSHVTRADVNNLLRALSNDVEISATLAAELLRGFAAKATATQDSAKQLTTAICRVENELSTGNVSLAKTMESLQDALHECNQNGQGELTKRICAEDLSLDDTSVTKATEQLRKLNAKLASTCDFLERLKATASRLEHQLAHKQLTVKQARTHLVVFVRAIEDDELRGLIQQIPLTDLRSSLLTLYDEAEGDFKQFKKNVEKWFDASMDRATAWYKRKTVGVQMVLAVAFAVGLNVDTLDVAAELSENPALRDAIVAQAEAYARDESKGSDADQREQLDALYRQVGELNLPIGWTGVPKDWWSLVQHQLAGWLITAVAVSLGAPFWFDLINRFVRIRTAGNMGTAPSEPTQQNQQATLPASG